MKIKLTILGMLSVLLITSGCVSPKLIAAMAKDQATSHLRISTVWGVAEYSRTVPTTNEIQRVFAAPLVADTPVYPFPAFTP